MLIHPDLLRTKHAVMEQHVGSVRATEADNATAAKIRYLIEDTTAIKKDCAEWARANITTDMLTAAIDVGLKCEGHLVNNFAEICRSWQLDTSEDNEGKIFHVLFGAFNKKQHWAED